ncbi:MAG: hypothetical protein ACI9F9_001761, partial [Candidatus Paceibacteria bacterium]
MVLARNLELGIRCRSVPFPVFGVIRPELDRCALQFP